MQLFDTHTHFDVADFDHDRQHLAEQAKRVGVDALVLIVVVSGNDVRHRLNCLCVDDG
jgi:Tat protein secretion system quality control protein TatD with DNase activity